jgi:hypothetical protein
MVMRARRTSPVDQRVTPVPFAAATWDRGFLFRTAADIFLRHPSDRRNPLRCRYVGGLARQPAPISSADGRITWRARPKRVRGAPLTCSFALR